MFSAARIRPFLCVVVVAVPAHFAVEVTYAQTGVQPPLRKFDRAALDRFGIRRIPGKHVTMYTDLPAGAEVDSLPRIFDQAFDQWCRYFGRDPAKLAHWHVNGFVIKDKAKFQANGMLPGDLPEFPNGYARGNEFWLYEQKSDYYRRHLFLHEGTHAFMFSVFGTCGPPWYMEGMAELLGTHQLVDGKLKLMHFPKSREEVPYLGRIKLVKDDVAKGAPMSLQAIMRYDGRAHRRTEAYAWCWAATVFLAKHPAYSKQFHRLYQFLPAADFNDRVDEIYKGRWRDLNLEWNEFIRTIEYGHDIPRTAMDFGGADSVPETGKIVKLRADVGWQNTHFELEAGKKYRIRAKGRYQIAQSDQPWPAEPGGVTIRYWDGKPLGQLIGRFLNPAKGGWLTEPFAIGLDHTFVAAPGGVLYLKVNDSPGELQDNQGTLLVHVVPVDK